MRQQVINFAEYFVETTVEMAQDMMADCPEEYTSYKDVENCVNDNLIALTDDNLDEQLEEFCKKVREVVKAARVKINTVHFNKDGFVDMNYDIKLEVY